ncbi:MAG: O-antigen ligase family protein [Fulvimarina manganoxydans]|uniref:O-antigen ligase family protein n=1 Tax=Fulvimarina manganoxydans TaxID=937218 RepID=UPI002355CEDF|nr:O-antigen ligase family protein [Fulvimarina manganoxydans]MCK5931183.1 O-antigen ligase family protein [Fulvimarina manganoxydans]
MRDFAARGLRGLSLLNLLCLFGLVSAVWVESDFYRYTAPFLLLEAILIYYFVDPKRPPIGLMGWLCAAWGAFVAYRLADGYLMHPLATTGSSEGIYLFPLIYPTLGYALLLHRRHLRVISLAFILISLVMVVATLHPLLAMSGLRAPFLIHHNPIHSAVAGGFIVLAAIAFALDCLRQWRRGWRLRRTILGLALAGILVSLTIIGILGAQSKGVWIALALALPIMGIMVIAGRNGRGAGLLVGATLLALTLFAILSRQEIVQIIGPSVTSATGLAASIGESGDPADAFRAAIASGSVPLSFEERLKIWVNAWEIWQTDLLLGTGLSWDQLWDRTTYADVGYRLMHNGYLEIAVRYGLVGLAFYALLLLWGLYQSHLCARRRLIAPAAHVLFTASTVYFCLTLLTNSNNRLALGESFMLITGAFAFYCRFLRWKADHGAEADDIRLRPHS